MGNALRSIEADRDRRSGTSGSSSWTKRNQWLRLLSIVVSLGVLIGFLVKGITSTFDQLVVAGALVFFLLELVDYVRLRGQRERAYRER